MHEQHEFGTIPKLEFHDGKAVMVERPATFEDIRTSSLDFLMGALSLVKKRNLEILNLII